MQSVNWEKLSVYFALTAATLTFVIYLSDMKERIAKLEVKVEKLEDKQKYGPAF